MKIDEIGAAIEKLIDADVLLARRFEILLSIPGISKITAFALLSRPYHSQNGRMRRRIRGPAGGGSKPG